MTKPSVRFDDGIQGTSRIYRTPERVISAWEPGEVGAALAAMEAARAAGAYLAGFAAYELGYVLEPALADCLPKDRRGPLLSFGVFGPPETKAAEAETGAASLSPLVPDWDFSAYAERFRVVAEAIRAGDIYQANLTFPLRGRRSGSVEAFYATMRARQPACCSALVALDGPMLLSASPELFFTVDAEGWIETRPMKGTAPRGANAAEDESLHAWLGMDAKNRAENLMIVDMLRNDLGRVAETGSVNVPELFHVETYPTLFQMTSTVRARLRADAGLAETLRAVMPCGSVTGTPKVQAMRILRDLETAPREAYCGAIGWIAPDGPMRFGVGIRTISLFDDGSAVYPVGSGLVADSEAASEYDECLLKARFLVD